MSSRYVSLAIDHGTTNSCIARMTPQGPEVILAEQGSAGGGAILPSAVYYDRRGSLFVGSAARKAIMTTTEEEGQGFTGYKLQIGGEARYEFSAAQKSMTAPELGSVIIQSLLRAHYSATGEDAKACVITIPAKFKQNSVEGTRAAAEMAGLKYYPLIMEPVAAAMRYGFMAEEQRAQWMVFDLGGGTLDVSLVIARKGKLVVPEGGHAGDDNLGGSKFDRELTGFVLDELSKKWKLSNFRNDRRKYSNEWGKLLMAVEEAKVKLSAKPEALVELQEPLCCDDQGKEVIVSVMVTRDLYENIIRPDAERAAQICQMLLKNNRIEPRDVGRLILVGGPSKTPLVRKLLAERLGIPLEHSIDPMTAVAEGAAIYADQVEIPETLRSSSTLSASGFSLRMECERQSSVSVYCGVGIVDGPHMNGLRVEIKRLDNGWQSPLIPVDPSGVFSCELILIQGRKPILSEFCATLLDERGKELVRLNEPQIWYPSLGVENRLANSLRVALKGKQTRLLIAPGAELPAEGDGTFVTTKALRRGSSEDVLRIAVLESVTHLLGKEDDWAEGCLHVGTLKILGSDKRVTSDVPAGSEIEVHLKVDESRVITAVAYIPLLDEHFDAIFVGEKFEYDLKDLQSRLEIAKYNIAEIRKVQAEKSNEEVADILETLRTTQLLDSVATDLERARTGDRDSEVRAYKRTMEVEGTVRALYRLQRRARIEMSLGALRGSVQGHEQSQLAEIEKEYIGVKTDEDLAKCDGSLGSLAFAVRGRPWNELRLDIVSLSGLKVTSQQNAVFVRATALVQGIEEKGGLAKATDADIAEMKRMHNEIEAAHPDLFSLRQRNSRSLAREMKLPSI